jgi:hypothetical protein
MRKNKVKTISMIDDIGPGFVLTTACLTAGFTLFYFMKANHTERMAKIARGPLGEDEVFPPQSFLEVKVGMLMAGVGIGLLLALAADKTTALSGDTVIYPAFMFVSGGFSLLASYFLVAKLRKKD